MKTNNLKNDFGQPVLKTKKDFETFEVENSSRPVRDETVEETADRYVWIHAGGDKPKSYDDPFIKKIDTMERLPKANKLMDQKLQGNKTLNYINQNKNMYQQENNKMLPTRTKLANMPILARNIKNYKNSKTPPTKTNATVERYKQFKEDKKLKEEDKKFNEDFEKEYSDQAARNYVRGKVNKNIKAGKAPYEDLPSSYLIVGEDTKARAHKQLASIKTEPVKLEPTYIDYRLGLKDPGPTISLEEHMAKTAPREVDPPGITALEGVKNFKRSFGTANRKLNLRSSNGVGGLLGEYDAN